MNIGDGDGWKKEETVKNRDRNRCLLLGCFSAILRPVVGDLGPWREEGKKGLRIGLYLNFGIFQP